MLRHLRFAPAVAFALLALALVGLWVRSYGVADQLGFRLNRNYVQNVFSQRGLVFLLTYDATAHIFQPGGGWSYTSAPAPSEPVSALDAGVLGFSVFQTPIKFVLTIPYWFLALSSLALAALVAFKPITRFTVRGLLIATTLLAAVLGLAVYAV